MVRFPGWLAGDPTRQLIAEAGETLLPETEAFAHETGVAEKTSEGFCHHRAGFYADPSTASSGGWRARGRGVAVG
jgi:hypothetical protein